MLYAMRLNMALGALGVDPRIINQVHRDAARSLGLSLGQTAQEVAILLLTQLPADFQNRANENTIRKWIASGKVRPQDQAVAEALQNIAFYNPNLSWRDFGRDED